MQRQIHRLFLTTLVLGFAHLQSPTAAEACFFRSRALASISGGVGIAHMYYQGDVLNFECGATPRRFALMTDALQDNRRVWRDTIVLNVPVHVGQTIWRNTSFLGCDSVWVAVAWSGYSLYGYKVWDDSEASGPLYSNCPPPPPPPPGCDMPYQDTQTLSLTASGAPEVAVEQLGVALTRSEERPEGMFLMEEWALLSAADGEPHVGLATTNAFKDRVRELGGLGDLAARGKVLVVEAPRHADNANRIPMPALQPVDVALPAGRGGGEFWFRAEVSAEGVVDRLMMLDDSNAFAERDVRTALKEHLALSYADERRHRMIVFGVATLDEAGRLRVDDTIVIPPQCCCIDGWCP